MKFSDRFMRGQLNFTRPFADATPLDTARSIQDKLGKIIHHVMRHEVVDQSDTFDGIDVLITVPRDEIRHGVILYLHGGGYTCGNSEYIKGFSSILCAKCGMRVVSPVYRLAPENPFPAALDDVARVYLYMLKNGYDAKSILFAGESAGGGLCYALALKLKSIGAELPAGILAVSPWVDLTLSGGSYKTNIDNDPSLSKERLEFFANCYVGKTEDAKVKPKKVKYTAGVEELIELRAHPLVSPVFADLTGMPPSLIFAGGDEILLSDAEMLNSRLLHYSAKSKLIVHPKMWHAYHLYCLKSTEPEYGIINEFINECFPKDSLRKLRWMGLDNAAKIFPASASSRWSNVFRVSATLYEDVDREVLQSALDVTVRRFPSISVRLRRGTFWYYLEEIAKAPKIRDEMSYPLSRMRLEEIRTCAFRVLVFKKRIAVEFFHALTDGNGGIVFLKTLVAEYISEKYGIKIPSEQGVLDRLEPPLDEELEDSFLKYTGKYSKSRKEPDSYRVLGEREEGGFKHVTTFILDSESLVSLAKSKGVTVTTLLVGAFIKAGINLQNKEITKVSRQKHVRVLIPVDLRRIYGSKTLRNFVLYTTPGVDPRLGEYTFDEICKIVRNYMALDVTAKNMSSKIYTNVKSEKKLFLKLVPLFLKNIVMKCVFDRVGERKSVITLSSLGVINMPSVMYDYVKRLDFILSEQSKAPYNVGVLSYSGITYLNIIRNIKEPRLEMEFYKVLREEKIHVKVESNGG